jgi:hypothetical protein
MEHTHIVQAGALEAYSDRRESEAVIPELIYQLVRQSVRSLSVCRIPYGEQIGQPGYDGLVISDESFREFVPKGSSYWEIGTGGDPQGKATKDFKKRTAALSLEERSESYFIFVTPRSGGENGWNGPRQLKWLNKRTSKGWKGVRIIDGVKLADWMREWPALGKWFAQKIGNVAHMGGLEIPTHHWELIRNQVGTSDPPLPAKIFLEGRESACTQLQALFEGRANRLLLFTEGGRDAEDFVSAYLASLDPQIASSFCGRCLFINEEDAWRSAVEASGPHVLVAGLNLGLHSDDGADLQTLATSKGHSVVIPINEAINGANPEILWLRSPSASKLQSLLREAGFTDVRSRDLANLGSLSALRRSFLGLSAPSYALRDDAKSLALAGLLGKWDGASEADRAAIEILLGKRYGEWIEALRVEALRPDAPLAQREENWRVTVRGEAWGVLGNRITDADLDAFKILALRVLSERDPRFDLPKDERYMATIQGKVPAHSMRLRNGISETLALLGSRPEALSSCSLGKAEGVVREVIRELLVGADWERWAGLNQMLPLLAEAAPKEFLEGVEYALVNPEISPFHQVFAQEGDAITGTNYTSGLLWALETLAWNPDYLIRVVRVLGGLASIDPGGRWSNRPANSMADILLPWHFQTTASISKRKVAVESVLQSYPRAGWQLLLALMPHSHGVTSGSRQPAWRKWIPSDWKNGTTHGEYREQVGLYAELAIKAAHNDPTKLVALVEVLPHLHQPSHDRVLLNYSAGNLRGLSESERSLIWEALNALTRKHRKYRDADWAMPDQVVANIEKVADLLSPTAIELRHRNLFTGRDYEHYEADGSYEEQAAKLSAARQLAVGEILRSKGIEAVIGLALNVSTSYRVGEALGAIGDAHVDARLLPALLFPVGDDSQKGFVGAYIWSRRNLLHWEWVDDVLSRDWTQEQKLAFLKHLPFLNETWTRVAQHLDGETEKEYWRSVQINPYITYHDKNSAFAIDKLIQCDRTGMAIQCLAHFQDGGANFEPELAFKALTMCLRSDKLREFDGSAAGDLISRLQKELPNDDRLLALEWGYLRVLGSPHGLPTTLRRRLGSDPKFFIEILGYVFRSKHIDGPPEEPNEIGRLMAEKGYDLLSNWNVPPGTLADGSFDAGACVEWVAETKRLAIESGHFDVACSTIGAVLTYVPEDPDGLWINKKVAEMIDAAEVQPMRGGFKTKLYNNRGVFYYTKGREELKLAAQYQEKADALDARGFTRFASVVRDLADGYTAEAAREAARSPFDDF